MDYNKYSIPNLPLTQQILEDLSNADIVDTTKPVKISASDDELLQNAYVCYLNFKQVEEDSVKITELNKKLEDLNHKLIENIGSMKTHS